VVNGQGSQKHPSEAKARRLFSAICGTAKAVPFQSLTFTTGCSVAKAGLLLFGSMCGLKPFPSRLGLDQWLANLPFGREQIHPRE
jgi:hypothetical protein